MLLLLLVLEGEGVPELLPVEVEDGLSRAVVDFKFGGGVFYLFILEENLIKEFFPLITGNPFILFLLLCTTLALFF